MKRNNVQMAGEKGKRAYIGLRNDNSQLLWGLVHKLQCAVFHSYYLLLEEIGEA